MAELEQFCILAKTLKGKSCGALIEKVLSHRKIFVFGELLSEPSVQSLRGTENEKALASLELFAYGTYQDFIADRNKYIDLTPTQSTRLKMLSLVTLASQKKVLSYADLQRDLELSSVREVESLVVDAIYSNLVAAKLDQKREEVHVHGAAARDVRPEDVGDIVARLRSWREMCSALITAMEDSSCAIEQSREEGRSQQREVQARVTEEVGRIKTNPCEDDFAGGVSDFVTESSMGRVKRSRGMGGNAGGGMGKMRFDGGAGPRR